VWASNDADAYIYVFPNLEIYACCVLSLLAVILRCRCIEEEEEEEEE
jgi:hypothetical protein